MSVLETVAMKLQERTFYTVKETPHIHFKEFHSTFSLNQVESAYYIRICQINNNMMNKYHKNMKII